MAARLKFDFAKPPFQHQREVKSARKDADSPKKKNYNWYQKAAVPIHRQRFGSLTWEHDLRAL